MAILLCMLVLGDITPPAQWQNPAAWHGLTAGCSADHVERILGEPAATESSRTLDVWYYQGTPENDTRPSTGRLIFRKMPDGTVTLKEFTQPDWSVVPSWTELNRKYREELLSQQQAAANQARANRPVVNVPHAPERPAVTTQRSLPRPSSNVLASPKPKIDSDQLAGKYFVGVGVAFGIMALIIGFTQMSRYFSR
jgi:hypothetical protein